MKKIILLLTGAVLLFAGCAKVQDEEVVTENGKHLVKIKATVENPGTRVSADIDLDKNEATFSWQAGDYVSILQSDGSYTSGDIMVENPGATADIEAWLDDGLTLGQYAYYPYAYRDESISRDEFVIEMDGLSYRQDETFMPMLGDITPSGAIFRAVGGVLKVHVTNIPPDAHFFELYVEGKQISGVFPITVVNDKKQITTVDSEYGNSIFISFWDDHVEAYATDFYIPLPCGTYDNLTFSLYKWEPADEYCLFSKTAHIPNGLEVERNDIIITPTLTVEIEKNTPNSVDFDVMYGYTLDENDVLHMDQYDPEVELTARIYGENESKPVEDVDRDRISCTLVNVTDPDDVTETDISFRYDGESGVTISFPADFAGEFLLRVYYDKNGDNPLMAESCKFKVYEAEPLPTALKIWSSSWFEKYRVIHEGNAYLKTYAAGTLYGTNQSLYPIIPNGSYGIGPFDKAFNDKNTANSFDAFQFFTKLTHVPDYAFSNCPYLKGIIIPEGVTSIGDYAFNGCSRLASVDLPPYLETIGVSAFEECWGLTRIVLPCTVTTISDNAFSGCSQLTSIDIPESVTTIGDWAFGLCAFDHVNIPASVTTLGDRAFGFCSSLVYAIFKSPVPPTITEGIDPVFDDGTTIYVPAGSESAYAAVFDNCVILTLPE